MLVEAGLLGSQPLFLLAITRNRDDQYVPVPGIGPNAFGNFVTVHARQADVEQNGIRTDSRYRSQRLLAVMREVDFAARQLQEYRGAFRNVMIVVDDKNA